MGGVRVIQVTNIAPQTTKDQMHTLFGYIGKIDHIQLYPTIREVAAPGRTLVCYVKYMDSGSVGVAQHLTNTVFIDRALIVVPFTSNDIPDEQKAFELTRPGPKLAPGVTNQIEGFPPNQVILTLDPRLIENNLPLYPSLPSSTSNAAVDEIRRTVVVTNLDRSVGSQDVIELFSRAGEVKYVRFCFRPGDVANYALIEFTDQSDIIPALKMNGMELAGNIVQVYHSTQAIVKPQPKSDEAAQREIQEAMSRVNEAQSLISAAIDPVMALLKKDKKRSRSRSRGRYGRSRRSRSRSHSRHKRRSRSRGRRSRSRSRRSRSRSRSSRHSRRSRSRDRDRDRKRTRTRTRTRTRSRSRRRSRSRSKRSRSHSKRSRSRSRRSSSRSRSSKSKRDDDRKRDDRRKDRDGDKEKRKRSSSKEKRSSSKDKRSPSKEKRKSKSVEPEKKRDRDRERERERDREKDSKTAVKESEKISEEKLDKSSAKDSVKSPDKSD